MICIDPEEMKTFKLKTGQLFKMFHCIVDKEGGKKFLFPVETKVFVCEDSNEYNVYRDSDEEYNKHIFMCIQDIEYDEKYARGVGQEFKAFCFLTGKIGFLIYEEDTTYIEYLSQ